MHALHPVESVWTQNKLIAKVRYGYMPYGDLRFNDTFSGCCLQQDKRDKVNKKAFSISIATAGL